MTEVMCPVKWCSAKPGEHCATRSGKNHPSRDAAIAYDAPCKAEDTVGSYPGDTTFFCELQVGHAGEHRATHEWAEGTEL